MSRHQKRESAVLSMPKAYKPKVLFAQSEVTNFQTFEADGGSGEKGILVKAIKNERCNTLLLRHELDKCKELMHPTLPRILQVHPTENYSYIAWRREPGKPLESGEIFEPSEVRKIAYRLSRCLVYLHSFGVVCRDLRYSNVIIDYDRSLKPGYRLKSVKLIDFGISKALLADERLAMLSDGSAFPSAYVKHEIGQFPAPEILVDLKTDRLTDSWFLGLLLYNMSTGTVPFKGDNNDDIRRSILAGKLDFANEKWLHASAELELVITSLLEKDSKQRAPVECVLWANYIPKMSMHRLHTLAVSSWLRKTDIRIDSEILYEILKFCDVCFDTSHLNSDDNLDPTSSDSFSDLKKKKKKKKGDTDIIHESFLDRNSAVSSVSKLSMRVASTPSGRSVIHQAKIIRYEPAMDSGGISDGTIGGLIQTSIDGCYATVISNVWLSNDNRPVTMSLTLDHIANDVFVGVLSREFEEEIMAGMPTEWSNHYLGCDDMSVGISLRTLKAFHAGQEICTVSRRLQPSFIRQASQHRYLQKFSITNAVDLLGGYGSTSPGTLLERPRPSLGESEESDDVFNIEFDRALRTPTTSDASDTGRKRSSGRSSSGRGGRSSGKSPMKSSVAGGQRAMRKTRVRMRIDCESHTLCVKIGDEMLEPVYFEFPGAYAISAAVTLCSPMDQITMNSFTIDSIQ